MLPRIITTGLLRSRKTFLREKGIKPLPRGKRTRKAACINAFSAPTAQQRARRKRIRNALLPTRLFLRPVWQLPYFSLLVDTVL